MARIYQAEPLRGAVEWTDALPSTNTELLSRVAAGRLPVPILATRHQTAGRGRLSRVWQTGAGRDLTFSFHWPDTPPQQLVSLPMAVALAVVDLLSTYGINAQTKWPNDVLVDGFKICGLLSESATDDAGRAAGVVVGVGLNVNMTGAEAAEIDRPATSMQILSGQTTAVEAVLERLLPLLNTRLAAWRDGGFAAIRDAWRRRAVWQDQPIELQSEAGPMAGILRGYGDSGELLLEVDGRLQNVWSAELVRLQR